MEIPSHNTILLKGIYFDDVQTLADKMFTDSQRNDDSYENIDHHKTLHATSMILPTKFKSISSWKESTKNMQIKCWECNLTFSGVPCFVPKQIKSSPTGKEFDTYGWFCGFACAYSFINHNVEYRINKTHIDKVHMLRMLYLKFYKRKVRDFYEAPNRFILDSYGGNVDINDFKSQLKTINQRIMQESEIDRTVS